MSFQKYTTLILLFTLSACKVVSVNSVEDKILYSKELEKKITELIQIQNTDSAIDDKVRVNFNHPGAGYIDENLLKLKDTKNIALQENLQIEKEFSFLVNLSPSPNYYWTTMGNLLWDDYKSKLRSVNISASEKKLTKTEADELINRKI